MHLTQPQSTAIQEAIGQLTADKPIADELAMSVAGQILAGEATPSQIGAFLTALRIRGETPGHLLAFARTVRRFAEPVEIEHRESLVDTCGTGGDLAGTFNISTAAAIVAAGAGARVAKHGNRAVTGRCGSADVLTALGVNIEMTPKTAARCLREAGLTFFFAPKFHGAMRHAAVPRREIGIRTILNLLGPLANPAGARRQLIGVSERRLVAIFAEVLRELGSTHAMIVHGSDGLDEITLTGPTEIIETRGDETRASTVEPGQFGLRIASLAELAGGGAEENAAIIRAILAGEKSAKRDIAELNAAAALIVADRAENFEQGLQQAKASIDTGAARRALDRLIEVSREVGNSR